MKRIYLAAALCLIASCSFAQKKVVKEAKSAMGSNNFEEARTLIKPALTDPETATDPETWKIAGDIEYKAFDNERTKEMTKSLNNGKGADEVKMYAGLYDMYIPYITADSLAQIPDAKGKVKNKVRKDILKNISESHPLHINAGLYYNDQRNYAEASKFFERYWEIPSLNFWGDEFTALKTDSTFQTIKYYAVITAIQAEDSDRAVKLLNKLANEPYYTNSTYKESDVYELLANEYTKRNDSINYIATLLQGAQKFPSNKYFTPNLINEYIKAGQSDKAIAYLDQAVANDPTNSCDLFSVKASLFVEKKDYDEASKIYGQALQADPNCERALEGQGVLCVLRAQDLKEKVAQTSIRSEQVAIDKETVEWYNKALPYLEKYRDLVKARDAEKREVRNALVKLQNVYYNLYVLKEPTEKQLEVIEEELKVIEEQIKQGL